VFVPATAVLIGSASASEPRVAITVYSIGVLLVFGTSASYHRLVSTPKLPGLVRRLHHAAIYLLIAATY